MSTPTASIRSIPTPIDADWTIADLITRLGDGGLRHDDTLRHPLALIEAALTGSSWRATPATVALTRSIVTAVRRDPALGTMRIGELTAPARLRPGTAQVA
ncbi:MAG TPA: hypothetical protein VN241_10010 [Microbacterium sp.]|nr:hypothetical protein [Microbacterium sp.]